MKYLFLILAVVLVIASVFTGMSMPDANSDVPVIYWVTDANPARTEQVLLFHRWMIKQGHYNEYTLESLSDAEAFVARNAVIKDTLTPETQPRSEDLAKFYIEDADLRADALKTIEFPLTVRLPKAFLKLDMGNRDATKQVIQGVSGVAGDIMDQGSGADLRYFRAIGLNSDVTEVAKKMGFDPSATFPALLNEIAIPDGEGGWRQYQFPCNVAANMYFVNRETFRQYGQPLPPRRWTIEEFEQRGKAFVEAANAGRERRTVFFADNVPIDVLRSSLGGSRFNETGTRCTLDEAPNIEALRLLYKWTYVDRLLPTGADRSSFTVESGYGGLVAQLFNNNFNPDRGQIAMMWTGRYLLIEFRKYDRTRKERGQPLLDYGVAEAPHGGFPNTNMSTRAAMVYAGGKHQDLAHHFLAFLASEDYNMQIVRDADSLPPNPKYTHNEEYLRPADHPNEWDVHGPFAEVAEQIAIASAYSPFILHRTADRLETQAREKFLQETPLAGFETPEKTARQMKLAIDAEMQRTINEDPSLRPLYERLLARQEQIDELKKQIVAFEQANPGQPIPEAIRIPSQWIENPFHQAYYKHKGWSK